MKHGPCLRGSALPAALAILSILLAPRARAATDPRWPAVRQVFRQDGESQGRYLRINLPRTDLRIRIGRDDLDPAFEFTSYIGFMPMGRDRVVAMGEFVLRYDEVPAVLTEAHRQNVRVTAVHNHLIGETPRIVYVHVLAQGAAEDVARRLRAVYGASRAPLGAPRETRATSDWSVVDAILGPHAESKGRVAEYVFRRRERLSRHGMAIESTGLLESASEAVFQKLPNGRVASTGELFVLPSEVDRVARALDGNGLRVTAIHNHMMDETPRMYWIHWYATGEAARLARGVHAALALMNSERRSVSEPR